MNHNGSDHACEGWQERGPSLQSVTRDTETIQNLPCERASQALKLVPVNKACSPSDRSPLS